MDFTNEQKFDNILLDIIQNVSSLPNFLDVIFGFLRRRTDLYYPLTPNSKNMGFLPGVAEKMITDTFKKHQSMCDYSQSSNVQTHLKDEKGKKKSIESPIKKKTDKEVTGNTSEHIYVADSESYNGATRDNYSWSQTIGELDIRVMLPCKPNVKDVSVTVEKTKLNVSIKNTDGSISQILDGKLMWEVKKHDVIWSYDPKENKVLISIEKVQERWWEAFFVGEETINTREIDCSRPMSDLDDEAQAKIHKLMYDNQQKQMGLPTSDEEKMNDILKKAWNVEGSPFQGTSFDPSQVEMIGNNS